MRLDLTPQPTPIADPLRLVIPTDERLMIVRTKSSFTPREGAYLVGPVRGRPDVDGVVTTGGGSNDVFRARFGACRAHNSSIVSI